MDVLKAELERKRKEVEASKANGGAKKYVRRGELKADAAAQSETAASVAEPAASADTAAHGGVGSYVLLPEAVVMERLRQHGQVVTYFGETDDSRCTRLQKYEAAHSLTGQKRSRSDEAEQQPAQSEGTGEPDNKRRRTEGSADGAASENIADGAAGAAASISAAAAGEAGQESDGEGGSRSCSSRDALAYRGKNPHKYVYRFWKGLICEWEEYLNSQPEAERRSAHEKEKLRLLAQTKEYTRPFFKKLKRKDIASDILELAAEMTRHCEDRDYRNAGDTYVRMAIGNAAWPIGVTAVGLHERAAREKVGLGKRAHVMNDEEQRKYITALKRLITVCQTKYPNPDPSKMLYT